MKRRRDLCVLVFAALWVHFCGAQLSCSGDKAEIDLVGYDGDVLTCVEVKIRSGGKVRPDQPEEAVTAEKRFHVDRMARRVLSASRITDAPWRFDVIAIESRSGSAPQVRLHKNAFAAKL